MISIRYAGSWTARLRVLFAILAAPMMLDACMSAPGQAGAQSGEGTTVMAAVDWGAVARKDIEHAHSVIQSTHPGVLDPEGRAFQSWARDGLGQALALAGKADRADRALAALRFYIAGYGDGHLVLLGGRYAPGVHRWAGWTVQSRGGQLVVTHRATKWKGEVPPLGARLVACDGVEAQGFLSQRLAPFMDRRVNLDATLSTLAARLTNAWPDAPLWNDPPASTCLLQKGTQQAQSYTLQWEESDEGIRHLYRPPPRPGLQHLGGGRYWVQASNFMLDEPGSQDVRELQE